MLPKHLFIPSSEYRHYSSDDLGVYGVEQAKLVKGQLPVLPSCTLSPQFFSFFYDQKTVSRIQTALEKNDAKQLTKAIQRISVEKAMIEELEKNIEQSDSDRLLSITLSPRISSIPPHTKVIPPSISNVTQAMVELMTPYGEAFLKKSLNTQLNTSDTFAPAFFFQFQRKFEKSGVIWTTDPTQQNKHHTIIKAWWGRQEVIEPFPQSCDTWIMNTQTGDVLDSEYQTQEIEFESNHSGVNKEYVPASRQQKMKLSQKEVHELLRLGRKTQDHLFFPQRMIWVKRHHTFYILESTELDVTLTRQTQDEGDQQNQKPLLTGTPMGNGSAQGTVRIVMSNQDVKRLKKSEIAVLKSFKPDLLHQNSCSGIICENALQPREFQHWSIPILGNCFAATKKLKNGEKVFLDSEERIVYC